MPFDPVDYQPRLPPQGDPTPRKLTQRSEAMLLYIMFVFAVLLMLAPVTPDGFADLIAYIRR